MSTSVPQAPFRIVCPIAMGAGTSSSPTARAMSRSFPLGAGVRLRTGQTGSRPPFTRTVEANTRQGFLTSDSA